MNPKISVITTVFNCESYIKQSIQSILNQTFKDFEYLIVNDGSTDGTSVLIRELASKDNRIIYIDNKTNFGRVSSLNTALEKTRGEYIALQDADDISLPDRFEKQFSFLSNNLDYVLVGSNIIVIDEFENFISEPYRPQDDLGAKFDLIFRCTFANPSIMYRKKVIEENEIKYEQDFNHVEDFRIITMISQYGKVYNLKNALVKYRKHSQNDSSVFNGVVNLRSILIVQANLARLGIHINCEQIHRIRNLLASRGMNKEYIYNDLKIIFSAIKKFQMKNNFQSNDEIVKTLKRMMKWLGKKNILRPKYMALYVSILSYYNKELFFRRN